MGFKRAMMFALCAAMILGFSAVDRVLAAEPEAAFPAYGSGPVEVRLYTDYFCPPCRAMEPNAEPLLKELLKKNTIRLTLVDVPIYQFSALFARNFLYALKENKDFEQALRVRSVLQNATANKEIKTQEHVEALFKEKGIAFSLWDPKPAFDRYNVLIKEDRINVTPTCVIIQNGQKKSYVGGPDIINALKALP